MNSFVLRDIEITVVLGEGTFTGGGNTKVMRGYGCALTVEKVGLPDKNKAQVGIYGINQQDMEQLTTLDFIPLQTEKNSLIIKSGDINGEYHQVFAGEITAASANYSQAPDVIFTIDALAGYVPSLMAIPNTSCNGNVAIVDLLEKLTKQAGYSYKNEGVQGTVTRQCLVGSPIEQIKKLAFAHNFQAIIDDDEVVTLPAGKARKGNTVYLSKETGLLGYPSFTSDGISLKCLYEPSLQLGGLIEVKSIVPKATGKWKITKLSHVLSANLSGDSVWQSEIEGILYD